MRILLPRTLILAALFALAVTGARAAVANGSASRTTTPSLSFRLREVICRGYHGRPWETPLDPPRAGLGDRYRRLLAPEIVRVR